VRPRFRRGATGRPAALLSALLALVLALALIGIPRAVEAADAPAVAPSITTVAPPAYDLEGFRWNRPVVTVYSNWDGGTCIFAGNNFTSGAPTIPVEVLDVTLQTSIAEINAQLRGGLTLQYAGRATRAELCSTSTTRPIVIGFGSIPSTGQALSFGTGEPGAFSNYTAARVFISTRNSFTCNDAPVYRDLQHTVTHEMLHAIGIGHSDIPSALMLPTFVACRTPYTMQSDDIAAVNNLYPPTLPPATGSATATPAPTATPAGSTGFVRPVLFSASGQSLAVFPGGTFDDLEAAARGVGATGVWVQDAGGAFRLLVVSGPAFLRD